MVAIALVICITLAPARALPVVGPDVDITTSDDSAERQQVEPTIAVDPHNPNVVVAGAQDYRLLSMGGHRWHGYYRSVDRGRTWSVMLLPGYLGDNSPQGLSSPLHGAYLATSDPVLAFDRSGNVYYVGITAAATFTTSGFNLFVAKFVNDGADYAFTTLLPPSVYGFADKPWITVDTSGGLNDGTVYVTYDTFSLSGGVIGAIGAGVALIRSTDGGVTYSLPRLAIRQGFASGVAVDAQGRVFVSSLTPGFSTRSSNIALAVSNDGGLIFHGHEIATTVFLAPNPLPGNFFRFFTVSVSGGTISIAWYDSRLGQLSNGTITALDVFYANSKDGGLTFSTNLRITSKSFNPNIVERADFGDREIFMGDYIQIAASPNAAHVIWTDNREACSNVVPVFGCTNQDAFTSTITL